MAKGGARVHIYGDWDGTGVKKAQQDIGMFERQAAGFGGAISKSMLGVGAAIGGAFAIGNIIGNVTDYLRDAAMAAAEDQKSMVALAKAMDNVGQGFAKTDAEKFIKQMMLATGVADDELRPAFQKLVTATGNAAKSQELLQTAMDISAGTGRDLASVSQALARASTGSFTALTRLGIPLDANIVKSKDFGAAVDVLNQKFGGQAAAASQTYAGQLKRVQTAAAEAQETIGYALLDAVNDLSQGLGGTGGMVNALTVAGDKVAEFVNNVSDGILILKEFGQELYRVAAGPMADSSVSADMMSAAWAAAGQMLKSFVGGPVLMLGETLDSQAEKADKAAEAATVVGDRYSALAASIDPTKAAFLGLADATEEAGTEMKDAKTAADFLKASLDKFTSRDDYITAMREMGKAAKEAGGDILGTKAKSMDLRAEFGNAATSLLAYAQAHGKNAADVLRIWDSGVAKMKQRLIDNGVKPRDVDAFVNPTLWQTKFTLLADVIGRGPAAEAMRLSGLAAGKQAWQGLVAALNSGEARTAVYNSAANLARQANAGARAALESASPSKVFMRIGFDTVEGLILGMDSKRQKVADKAKEIAQGVIDAGRTIVDGWDAEVDRLKGVYDDALADFQRFKDGITADIFGQLDLGAAISTAKETGGSVVDAFAEQAKGITSFAQNLISLTKTNLSQTAWSAVAALNAENGKYLTDQMLGAQGQAVIDGVNQVYADVETAANAVGVLAADKWKREGVQYAQANYEGFKAFYGKDGPGRAALMNLMDNLAASMNRTARVTVVVDEVSGAKVKVDGKRASGGPVWPGGAFIVGERGPELFMPDVKGQILPSASMPSAGSSSAASGGRNYNINVSTGVGDPRMIGQQIVEYVRRYESANGRVFAPAA